MKKFKFKPARLSATACRWIILSTFCLVAAITQANAQSDTASGASGANGANGASATPVENSSSVKRFYPGSSARLQVGTEEFLKNYSSLAGLEGIYVNLSYVYASSEKNGIEITDDLEEQVRKRLAAVDIEYLTEQEMEGVPGQPEMAVFPSYTGGSLTTPKKMGTDADTTPQALACGIDSCCRNSVWVSFSQSASILRHPNSQYKLGTWGNGEDSNLCENRGKWMYDGVLAVIDSFVEDFKKAKAERLPIPIGEDDSPPANCAQAWSIKAEVFETDSSSLSLTMQTLLDKLVAQADRCSNYFYLIETHADKRAKESYNKLLTVARAAVIKEYLLGNGVGYSRLKTVAHGESKPVSDGETEADHAANRRVVITPSIALVNF